MVFFTFVMRGPVTWAVERTTSAVRRPGYMGGWPAFETLSTQTPTCGVSYIGRPGGHPSGKRSTVYYRSKRSQFPFVLPADIYKQECARKGVTLGLIVLTKT